MMIEWMRTGHRHPELDPSELDFVALDSDRVIGRVHQFAHGTEAGRWSWSMKVVLPGSPFVDRSGIEDCRGNAARRVVEAYERLLARPRERGA